MLIVMMFLLTIETFTYFSYIEDKTQKETLFYSLKLFLSFKDKPKSNKCSIYNPSTNNNKLS